MNDIIHTPAWCSIEGCPEEATRWLDGGDHAAPEYPFGTFYLCESHAEQLSLDDCIAAVLDPTRGRIRVAELGIYSCHEQCRVCNP